MNVTLEELKAEVLQNPEVRAEYERLRPEFELAETIITARQPGGFHFWPTNPARRRYRLPAPIEWRARRQFGRPA